MLQEIRRVNIQNRELVKLAIEIARQQLGGIKIGDDIIHWAGLDLKIRVFYDDVYREHVGVAFHRDARNVVWRGTRNRKFWVDDAGKVRRLDAILEPV